VSWVGVLILAGAQNTSIVGANGVLKRVAKTASHRRVQKPHLASAPAPPHQPRGRHQLLTSFSVAAKFSFGRLYAFGVIWSFALKGLAVTVLRYKEPGHREWRVR